MSQREDVGWEGAVLSCPFDFLIRFSLTTVRFFPAMDFNQQLDQAHTDFNARTARTNDGLHWLIYSRADLAKELLGRLHTVLEDHIERAEADVAQQVAVVREGGSRSVARRELREGLDRCYSRGVTDLELALEVLRNDLEQLSRGVRRRLREGLNTAEADLQELLRTHPVAGIVVRDGGDGPGGPGGGPGGGARDGGSGVPAAQPVLNMLDGGLVNGVGRAADPGGDAEMNGHADDDGVGIREIPDAAELGEEMDG